MTRVISADCHITEPPHVFDRVPAHLRDRKVIRLDRFEQPELIDVNGNAGFEEFTP